MESYRVLNVSHLAKALSLPSILDETHSGAGGVRRSQYVFFFRGGRCHVFVQVFFCWTIVTLA